MILRIETKTSPNSKEVLPIVNARLDFTTTSEDFANDLGKDLYRVETLGCNFITSEIYEKVLSGYQSKESNLKTGKFTIIYTLENEVEIIKISVCK